MNPAEMIVAIVALVVIGGVLRSRIAAPGHRQRGDDTPGDDDIRRLAQEVQHLKARIQVLERVITDRHGSSDLEREIDALRNR